MTTELKTVVAELVPHVADALQTFAEGDYDRKARAYIEGYLIAARNSGNLLDAHCERLLLEVSTVGGQQFIAVCFPDRTPKLPPITEGERSLYRWQYKITGGFEKALWAAIIAADSTNLAAIDKGFPLHVAAYRRYANESGYWDALTKRIQAAEQKQ